VASDLSPTAPAAPPRPRELVGTGASRLFVWHDAAGASLVDKSMQSCGWLSMHACMHAAGAPVVDARTPVLA